MDVAGSWQRVRRSLGPGTHRVRWASHAQSLAIAALDDISFLPPRTEWAAWIAEKGLPPETSAADDSDGDGTPLLVEFGMGGDPARSDGLPAPGMGVDSSGRPLLTIRRPDYIPDVTFSVEESANMQSWTSTGVTKQHEDATQLVFRGSRTGKAFLRVRVALP